MNGPEHYAEAERLIALAEQCDWTTEAEPYRNPALLAAQAHASLALVAATVTTAEAIAAMLSAAQIAADVLLEERR